jgi:hypothetical protein
MTRKNPSPMSLSRLRRINSPCVSDSQGIKIRLFLEILTATWCFWDTILNSFPPSGGYAHAGILRVLRGLALKEGEPARRLEKPLEGCSGEQSSVLGPKAETN